MHRTDYFQATPSYYKRQTIIKICQLLFQVLIGLLYFIMIITNESISSILFSNKPVFFLSVFMWMLLLSSFVGSFYDFYTLQININNAKLLSRIAYLDTTTGIPNRNSCDDFIKLFHSPSSIRNAGCAVISITNLSSINMEFGRDAGNTALKVISSMLEDSFSSIGFVGRNGSNHFLAIAHNCDEAKIDSIFQQFTLHLDSYNNLPNQVEISVKFSYILNTNIHAADIHELIRTTYEKHYEG